MTEFNFKDAVEEAKHDFPEKTKNVTFVDLDADDADEQLRAWINGLSEITKGSMNRTGSISDFTSTSTGFAFYAPQEDKRIVAMHSKYCEKITMFQHAPEKQAAYVFDHELAHIVVPDAETATNKAEHAADDFAAMRGLKRGSMDKKDIKLIADARAVDFFLSGDLMHLTTISLDSLLVNPKNTNFISLQPQEMTKIAGAHAKTFANSKEVREELTSAFIVKDISGNEPEQAVCQKRLEQLGQVCLDAPKNSLQFYVAARIVKSAMEHGGVNNMPLDTSGSEWEKISNAIDKKTMGRDLGAKLAVEKPLIDNTQTPGFIDRLRKALSI